MGPPQSEHLISPWPHLLPPASSALKLEKGEEEAIAPDDWLTPHLFLIYLTPPYHSSPIHLCPAPNSRPEHRPSYPSSPDSQGRDRLLA